jgi:hypothetical protein
MSKTHRLVGAAAAAALALASGCADNDYLHCSQLPIVQAQKACLAQDQYASTTGGSGGYYGGGYYYGGRYYYGPRMLSRPGFSGVHSDGSFGESGRGGGHGG